jgi:hypothetical protein
MPARAVYAWCGEAGPSSSQNHLPYGDHPFFKIGAISFDRIAVRISGETAIASIVQGQPDATGACIFRDTAAFVTDRIVAALQQQPGITLRECVSALAFARPVLTNRIIGF